MANKTERLLKVRDARSKELSDLCTRLMEGVNKEDRCSKLETLISKIEDQLSVLFNQTNDLAVADDETLARGAIEWFENFRISVDSDLEKARNHVEARKTAGHKSSTKSYVSSTSRKSSRVSDSPSVKLAKLKLEKELLAAEFERQKAAEEKETQLKKENMKIQLETDKLRRDEGRRRQLQSLDDQAKVQELETLSEENDLDHEALSIASDNQVQNWVDSVPTRSTPKCGCQVPVSTAISCTTVTSSDVLLAQPIDSFTRTTTSAQPPISKHEPRVDASFLDHVVGKTQIASQTCSSTSFSASTNGVAGISSAFQQSFMPQMVGVSTSIGTQCSTGVSFGNRPYDPPSRVCVSNGVVNCLPTGPSVHPAGTNGTAELSPVAQPFVPPPSIPSLVSKYSNGPLISRSFEKSLPKWKLSLFSGDPLDWPEWRGMFINTVERSSISSDEKMNHLKTLLTGKAKAAIAGFAFSGAMYPQAWATLERKFGRPHVIVGAQLDKLARQPSVRMHNSESLIEYSMVVSSFVNVLTQLGYQSDLESSSNLQTVVNKLSPNLKEKWFEYLTNLLDDRPNLFVFNEWLQNVAETHERILSSKPLTQQSLPDSRKKFEKPIPKPTTTFVTETKIKSDASSSKHSGQCPDCTMNHKIWLCPEFKKRTATGRAELAKQKRLCFSCLNSDHQSRDCPRKKTCGRDGCSRSHNSLLHGADRVHAPLAKEMNKQPEHGNSLALAAQSSVVKGILQIAKVKVLSMNGFVETFALCDTGSSHSWIAPSLHEKLGIEGENDQLTVESFNDRSVIDTSRVSIKIESIDNDVCAKLTVFVKPNFTLGDSWLDVSALKQEFPQLEPVADAQIDFKHVEMLLGQDAFALIRPLEYRSAGDDQPWAVRLPLGWVVSGPLPGVFRKQPKGVNSYKALTVDSEEATLSEQVRKWWDIESYGSGFPSADTRSKEDQRALAMLEKTTFHDGERYVVGMLWESDSPDIQNNYSVARSQLTSLEKRLAKDHELRLKYKETIQTDIDKGYARILSKEELIETKSCPQWYLPHHPVLNPNKPGKVRRVCNAASKFKGVSLNDTLLTGPDLLNNLIGLLMRFRKESVAFAADIEGMFLQVAVNEIDQRTLRFLWREDPSKDVDVIQYTRHIFGAKDSPTCANYALRRTAIDNKKDFPDASAIVLRDFYMDDILKSVETREDALRVAIDLKALLQRGGFNLMKFVSNDEWLLQKMIENELHVSETNINKDTTLHVLGVKWFLEADKLVVSRGTTRSTSDHPTQREILSLVSSVFDPLGLIAPFTIRSRLVLKSIWQSQGQSWDEPVKNEEANIFKQWLVQLPQVQSLTIKRQYFTTKPESVELHVFGDASLEAMCAVAYLRAKCHDGFETAFIIGKSRVAPLRNQTIPKLELQASLIACRLKKLVQSEIDMPLMRTVMWTDSSTVLQWLHSSHKKQQVFVANRVAEILETASIDEWRHVPGEQNPADCGTRGLTPSELISSMWINGPAFLLQEEQSWPSNSFVSFPDETSIVNVATTYQAPIDWSRFSTFSRLVRVIAHIRRLKILKKRSEPLSVDELSSAKHTIWILCQKESFAKERNEIQKTGQCPEKSPLAPSSPFLCSDGLLRAKGRLRKATSLTFEARHPVLLSCSHPAVKLFLKSVHCDYHHEGVEYLRSVVQQELWIVKLRSALRSIKLNCLRCKKARCAPLEPEMADLPADRLRSYTFPFASTGVDYFGPFEVRLGRKTFKRWCFLFCCLTTRAVHIEICHSLDADSCVMAIKRFVARRGKPNSIVSDNGTNFVGAVRELRECLASWNKHAIETSLSQEGIRWRFNPPAAPHFGGVWERLVRSCKRAMFNILGCRRLTDELLTTVMGLVEQTMNARPITPVSSDVDDLEALTPNHFILGRPSVVLPAFWTNPKDVDLRKSFKQAEAYADIIWKRWLTEYLPIVSQRSKWRKQDDMTVKAGDLVWLLDPSQPRCHYPLGRILELHFGDDGVARSARVRTQSGIYTRPLVKIVPLNVNPEDVPDEQEQGRRC